VSRRIIRGGWWAAAAAGLLASHAMGQVFSLHQGDPPQGPPASVPGPRPSQGWLFDVDTAALGQALSRAPQERADLPLAAYGLATDLPGPNGGLVTCRVAESPVMDPALAARFPQIRTFLVEAADGSASGRIEMAPRGLTGMLRTVDGRAWMIDLWQSADPVHVEAYWLTDLSAPGEWTCHTVGNAGGAEEPGEPYQARTTQTLRTVRLAVACTGEWGLHQCDVQGHGPNVADPLAAIVTVVARANVVYEADLAVHFNLVANEDQIVYTNPDTDPYSTTCDGSGGADCSGPHLGENINNLAAVIGNANFDIGQLLTRIFGGVAYLPAVCGSSKAGGISGIPRGGDIDPFTALVIIHEMGHQFGANHTFSGTRGRCAGNVNLSTAWEAGSGSSPMAYPGGCPVGNAPPSDNVALFADPFFHHGSYNEMRAFLTDPGTTCPVLTATANNIPVIATSTPSTAIPPGTPFILTAAATDADNETLTYSWEEFDSGTARPLSGTGSQDNGTGALFRVFPPVTVGYRTFPRMADVLSGVPTPGEQLPSVTGVNRRFRVIVRDNHSGAGGVVVSPFTTLSIAGTGPFAVTAPTEGSIFRGGSAQVTWTVGGTSASPISCSTVTIRLSTDGGATFPTVLGSYPNNGSATVNLPTMAANGSRLRIDGNGNIFFAVSRPIDLRLPCTADFNHDGDIGTDADIEGFFACLAGNCCATCGSADFDGDGDVGTDADIESFFRVLGGGPC
jgi:hypothetical protein